MVAASNNMYFDWKFSSVVLVAHTRANPEPATWSAMCRSMQALRASSFGTLVFTDGGGPNSAQRGELEEATQDKVHRVSVVSGAAGPRFIVSSMSLFNPTIQAFAPPQLKAALKHLGLSEPEGRQLAKAMQPFVAGAAAQRFETLVNAFGNQALDQTGA